MEPLTALSVASSTIQIVDFSSKLIKQIYDLYTSDTGEIKQYKELKQDVENLQGLNCHLSEALDPDKLNRQLTELEANIATLSQDCNSAAVGLLDALKSVSLDTNPNGKRKKWEVWKTWESVQKAVKAVWVQKDMDELKARLDKAQQLLSNSILVNIQKQLMTSSDENYQVSNRQTTWDSAQPILHWLDASSKDTKQWQKNILEAVDRSSKDLLQAIQSGAYSSLPTWTKTPVAITIIDRLLATLRFSEMPARYERIADAFARTFEWIFSEPQLHQAGHPWDSFRHWLQSGHDIYWITGKAGSGKSTLMKLIYDDPRTKQMLQNWRQRTQVVTAAFFFWNSGTTLQMSQTGLLRSLLHQVLTKRRQLVQESLPSNWEALSLSKDFSNPWTFTELSQAFRLLAEESSDISYVFFVDGLDELEGDKTELIRLVQRLALHPNFKFCVSSRPWAIFEDAFRKQPSLMLQYRTYGDIKHYVEDNLLKHPGFHELHACYPNEASDLMENISTKASGVFLWVVLVVSSLKEGFTDGDRTSDLQRRLDHLPDELDELFRKMLYSQKPAYLKEATQLFRLFRAAKSRPTVLLLSFADEKEDEYAFQRHVGPLHCKELYHRARSMKRRLDSRCKGLLEIPSTHVLRDSGETMSLSKGLALANTPVEYLHRTVKDFFAQPQIWDYIVAADPNFDPSACLSRAFILQTKTLAPNTLRASDTVFWDAITWCMEYALAVSKQNMVLHERLLDELDKAAISLTTTVVLDMDGNTFASKFGQDVHPNSHWASFTVGGQPNDTFLTFAARCHFLEYVEAKVTGPDLNESDRVIICTNLLCAVIASYEVPFGSPDRLVGMQTEPSVDIVKLLLSCGANPNGLDCTQSPWQCLMEMTTGRQRQSETTWKSVTEALKEHGAVTNCKKVEDDLHREPTINTALLHVPPSLHSNALWKIRRRQHGSLDSLSELEQVADAGSDLDIVVSLPSPTLHIPVPGGTDRIRQPTKPQSPHISFADLKDQQSQKTFSSRSWISNTTRTMVSRLRNSVSKRSSTASSTPKLS